MENFIVSARKYRPTTFDAVVGQAHITSTLKNAIIRDHLAHAYLFCGPRGVGKTTCARIFAKAINCLAPVNGEACNQCESCRSFNEGRSFNIHELDAASNNSVDDIRSLTDQIRIPPQVGRYSVYIIDEVHMLSVQAFNAFLKTLEEPPAHVVFILATTEKHKIIPTILSRCQIFEFNRIRVEDSVRYLQYVAGQEGVTYDDESMNLIAQKAYGGMRDALSIFDKVVSFCGTNLTFKETARALNVLDYDAYFKSVDTILAGDYAAALVHLDNIISAGFSEKTFLAGLASHMRDLMMCRSEQTIPLLEITGSLTERYKQQAARCDNDFLFAAIALLAQLDNDLRLATNKRLTVELGLMKLCRLSQKKNEPLNFELPPLQQPAANRTAQTGPTQQTAANRSTQTGAAQQTATNRTIQTGPAQQPAQNIPPQPHRPATATTPISGAGASTPAPAQQDPQQPSAPQRPATPRASESGSGTHNAPNTILNNKVSDQTAAQRPATDSRQPSIAISGASIASLISRSPRQAGTDAQQPGSPARQKTVDPDTDKKIELHRQEIISLLKKQSIRLGSVFSTMKTSANRITIEADTELLAEEIRHNQNQILQMIASVAGIDGALELEILKPSQEYKAPKPIRPEEKLQYLREKNPLVDRLRREIDLDIE